MLEEHFVIKRGPRIGPPSAGVEWDPVVCGNVVIPYVVCWLDEAWWHQRGRVVAAEEAWIAAKNHVDSLHDSCDNDGPAWEHALEQSHHLARKHCYEWDLDTEAGQLCAAMVTACRF